MQHERVESGLGQAAIPHYHVGLARSASEIREAQKLRYRIFAEEMGARLHCREEGVDSDFFDPYCEHLIVRDEAQGRIVGTYRILTPEAARRVGGYYTETEFDLTRLQKATLQFSTWYNIEKDYDYAYVEVSTDSGKTWDTPYRVFVGNGAAFEPGKRIGPKDFSDGLSNTIAVVEAAEPVGRESEPREADGHGEVRESHSLTAS